jgi:hypothetical protein
MKNYTSVVIISLFLCMQIDTIRASTGPERLTSRSNPRAMRIVLAQQNLTPHENFFNAIDKFSTVVISQSTLNQVSLEDARLLQLHVQFVVQPLRDTIPNDDRIKYAAATVCGIIQVTGNNFNFVKSVQDLKRAAQVVANDYRIA